MRELEFRAWDIVTKRYYSVCGLDFDDDGKLSEVYLSGIQIDESNPNANVRKPSDVILELSTGLKDKNGQKIYNGDIVSEEFEYGGEKTRTVWQVRWCDDECAFELHYVSGFEVEDCSLVSDDKENYEVIGNIVENKDLLEEEDAGN